MYRIKLKLIGIALTALISSCTYDEIKSQSYDAAHIRSCIENTGESVCDEEHPSYEEYNDERKEINKAK